jgi:hypothetical protein
MKQAVRGVTNVTAHRNPLTYNKARPEERS